MRPVAEHVAFLARLTTSTDPQLAQDAHDSLSGLAVKGFDPMEARDEHGRWTLIGAIEHAVAKDTRYADGAVHLHVDHDGVHLGLTNHQGGVNRSGALDHEQVWDLVDRLDSLATNHDSRAAHSVASYPPGDPRAAPTGFAEIRRTGPDSIALELLDTGHTVTLSNTEAAHLANDLARYGAASRVHATSGPVDVYVTDHNQFGLRTTGVDGTPVDLHLNPTSWRRVRQATNVVNDGFDELNTFVHGPAAEHVSEVHITTSAGPMVVRRLGEVDGANTTISLAPASGNQWEIRWGATYHDPMWAAFDNVEHAGGVLDFYDY